MFKVGSETNPVRRRREELATLVNERNVAYLLDAEAHGEHANWRRCGITNYSNTEQHTARLVRDIDNLAMPEVGATSA